MRTCLGRPAHTPRCPEPQCQVVRLPHLGANMIRRAETATEPPVVPVRIHRPGSFFVDEAGRKICASVHVTLAAGISTGGRARKERYYACWAAACLVEIRSEERGPTCPPSAPHGELTCPTAALVKEASRANIWQASHLAGTSHAQWSCHRPRHRKRIASTTSEHGAGQP